MSLHFIIEPRAHWTPNSIASKLHLVELLAASAIDRPAPSGMPHAHRRLVTRGLASSMWLCLPRTPNEAPSHAMPYEGTPYTMPTVTYAHRSRWSEHRMHLTLSISTKWSFCKAPLLLRPPSFNAVQLYANEIPPRVSRKGKHQISSRN